MRKKGLFLIVSIVMILSISSCGSKSENPGTADSSTGNSSSGSSNDSNNNGAAIPFSLSA